MDDLAHELRLALRTLRKSPGHAALATLILSCGLGLTLFMFSAINAYVLKPLPFPDSQEILHLEISRQDGGTHAVPLHDFLDWREQQTSFDGLAAYYSGTINLSWDRRPVRFEGGFVSANTFDLLGVRPVLGRTFVHGEDDPAAALVVLLGHDVWRNYFGAHPEVIGTTVRANGQEAEVIGVMPPGFAFPGGHDLWLPLRMDHTQLERGQGFWLEVIGRIRDGVSLGQARAEMATISEALARLHPETNEGATAVIQPLAHEYVDLGMRLVLAAMFGSVLLVLVIACANVANLLFVRFASREREIAVRAALGAGRWRLVSHILAECLLISTVATAMGFAIAQVGARLTFDILRANWDEQPFWTDIAIDWRSVVFAAFAALLTTVLAGLVPALRASSAQTSGVLRSGGRGISGSPLGRLSRALIVIEIALSCVVLICSGLMVRSVLNLERVDIGADTDKVLAGRIGLFESAYPQPEDRVRFYEALTGRLAELPGIEGATVSTSLPGTFTSWVRFSVEGEDTSADGSPIGHYSIVAPGYFDFFKVPILVGRGLDSRDRADSLRVAVVSDLLAERLGGAAAALGRRVRLGGPDDGGEWLTIVGVVPTIVQAGVRNHARPSIYVPLAQEDVRFVSLALRTAGDPLQHAQQLRQTVTELDPDLPVYWLQTLDEWIDEERFIPRFLASMFALFAAAGLVLAAAGLYGVLGYTVVVRTQEFGVRRALGATGKGIVALLARQGTVQLAVGLVCGLAGATGFARLLAGELFDVPTFDLGTYATVAAALAATAVLASVLPARRALAVDPAEALRTE